MTKYLIPILLTAFLTVSLNAQFKSLNGPFKGDVFQYHNTPEYCYVSNSNGLYRSSDNAANWVRSSIGLPDFYECLAFAADKNELFMSYAHLSSNKYGFAYSSDYGENWVILPSPYEGWLSFNLAYKSGILVTTVGQGNVIESYDKGKTWIENKDPDLKYCENIYSNNEYFFLISDSEKVYRKKFNESEWKLMCVFPNYGLSFHVSDSTLIFLPDRAQGYCSIDQGVSWKKITMSAYNGYSSLADFGNRLYYINDNYVYKSTNKGLNWKLVKEFENSFRISELFRAGQSLILSSSSIGLVKSNEALDSFSNSNVGLNSSSPENIFNSDKYLFTSEQGLIDRMDIKTGIWENCITRFDNESFESLQYINNILFATTNIYTDFVYRSEDDGKTFIKIELPKNQPGRGEYSAEIIQFNSSLIINRYGTYSISYDKGLSWKYLTFKDSIGNKLIPHLVSVLDENLIFCTLDWQNNVIKHYKTSDLLNCREVVYNFINVISPFSFYYSFNSSKDYFFYEDRNGKLFKYTKFNDSIIQVNITTSQNQAIFNIKKPKLLERNGKLMLMIYNEYFISNDDGMNWYKVIDDLNDVEHGYFRDMTQLGDDIVFSSYYIGTVKASWDDFNGGTSSGTVYFDRNRNNSKDINEAGIENSMLKLNKSSGYLSTNDKGNFSFTMVTINNDTIIPIYNTKHGSFEPALRSFFPGQKNLDFGFQLPINMEDVSVDMINVSTRPGFPSYFGINLRNCGNSPISGDLIFDFDTIFNYVESNKIPDQLSINQIVWKIKDLQPLENNEIYLSLFIPNSVSLGTKFKNIVRISNLNIQDIDLSDNVKTIEGEVKASCDPNDILVDKEQITKTQLINDIPLEYTINFQNIGNAVAEKVEIRNYIADFDISSFKVISSSHNYTYKISKDGMLTIAFDMINLPDSTSNELNSHGYIKYSINPGKRFIYFKEITNSALIYFDYNAPIATNYARTQVVDLISKINENKIQKNKLEIFPNPSNSSIALIGDFISDGKKMNIDILNSQGDCVMRISDKIYKGYTIDLTALNSGLYFLRINEISPLIKKLVIIK